MSRVSREVRIEQAIAYHSTDDFTDEQIAAELKVPLREVLSVRKYLDTVLFDPKASTRERG